MFLNKFLKNHLTIPQATNLFEEIKSQTHPNINDLERLVKIHKALMETKNIPLKVLDKYFEIKNDDNDDSPLRLKYQAMQITPTTIEKTMTPIQLFITRNPLWTLDLTGYQIKQVINSGAGILELEKILSEKS